VEQRVAALVLRHVECVDGGRRNFAVHLRLRDYAASVQEERPCHQSWPRTQLLRPQRRRFNVAPDSDRRRPPIPAVTSPLSWSRAGHAQQTCLSASSRHACARRCAASSRRHSCREVLVQSRDTEAYSSRTAIAAPINPLTQLGGSYSPFSTR